MGYIHCLSSNLGSSSSSSKDFLSAVPDDATSDGEVGVVLKEQIDLAGSLATLVDTPSTKDVSFNLSSSPCREE